MSGNIAERVARLENEVGNINKAMNKMDADTGVCQTRQAMEFTKLNARIETFINNELVHANARMDEIERERRDPLTWTELGKIVIAVVTTLGLIIATYIQYWGPK